MLKFLLGFVLGIVLVAAGAYFYFSLGYAPVAATAPPMPFEGTLARKALHARIAREAPSSEPIQPDEANLLAGARIYHEQCALCHGVRGQAQIDIAKGMFPKPPHLLKGKGVTDDPAGETYWKAKNGIRLSGMPAFGGVLGEEQLWQVSLFLAKADKLPPSAERIAATPLPSLAAAPPSPADQPR